MTWRAYFRPMIAEVVGCFSPGDDPTLIKQAVMATYPDDLRPRKYWPYRVWCSETRRQIAARHHRTQQRDMADLPLFCRVADTAEQLKGLGWQETAP